MSARWKISVSLAVLLTIFVLWFFYDEPLHPDTRKWLKTSHRANPENDAVDYLDELTASGRHSFWDVVNYQPCSRMTIDCTDHIRTNREALKTRMPTSASFWNSLEGAINSDGITGDPKRMLQTNSWFQNYISGIHLYFIRELIEHDRIRPAVAIKVLEAQRRLLSETPLLINKMIFVATHGIALDALWVSLRAISPNDPEFASLLTSARPMTKAELSYKKVFQHELQLMSELLKDFPPSGMLLKRQHTLNYFLREYRRVSNISELSENEFWQLNTTKTYEKPTLWDWLVNPYWSSQTFEIQYSDHLLSLRQLDLQATVIRAWGAAIQSGYGINTIPDTETPPHWVWDWQDGSLCLIADSPLWKNEMYDLCQPHKEIQYPKCHWLRQHMQARILNSAKLTL